MEMWYRCKNRPIKHNSQDEVGGEVGCVRNNLVF